MQGCLVGGEHDPGQVGRGLVRPVPQGQPTQGRIQCRGVHHRRRGDRLPFAAPGQVVGHRQPAPVAAAALLAAPAHCERGDQTGNHQSGHAPLGHRPHRHAPRRPAGVRRRHGRGGRGGGAASAPLSSVVGRAVEAGLFGAVGVGPEVPGAWSSAWGRWTGCRAPWGRWGRCRVGRRCRGVRMNTRGRRGGQGEAPARLDPVRVGETEPVGLGPAHVQREDLPGASWSRAAARRRSCPGCPQAARSRSRRWWRHRPGAAVSSRDAAAWRR